MKTKLFLLIFLLLSCGKPSFTQDKPSLSEIDRVRIAEAFRLDKNIGEKLWKDWGKVPFAVLLIMPDYKFLIRHPKPSKDFTLLGYDSLLKSDIYFRKRVFQTDFLATFNAGWGRVDGCGRAERYRRSYLRQALSKILHSFLISRLVPYVCEPSRGRD